MSEQNNGDTEGTPTPDPTPDPTTEIEATPASAPTSAPDGGPPAAGGRSRAPIVVSIVLVLLVLGAAIGLAYALGAFTGSGDDTMAAKVPEDTMAYATVYLDPSGTQKQNVAGLLSKFPALQEVGIDTLTGDEMWSDMGIDYSQHIEPWLGNQVAVGVGIDQIAGPGFAILLDSKDDGAAQDAIRGIQSAPAFEGYGWRSLEHEGVEIAAGTAPDGEEFLVTVTDGVVIISTSQGYLFSVIDTIDGDPSLAESDNFTETIAPLPEDRLALAYVDVESLVQLAAIGMSAAGDQQIPAENPFASALGFRGLGMTFSAEPDGLAMRMTTLMDPSRFTDDQRELLAAQPAPHESSVLPFVPVDAYGVLTINGVKQTIEAISSQLGSIGGNVLFPGLDQALAALEGDAGFMVSPGATPDEPGAALLIAINDPQAAQDFMTQMEAEVANTESSRDPQWKEEPYEGTTIRSVSDSEGTDPFAYAVTDTMVIAATGPDEVKEALDTQASGSSITSSPVYQEAISHGSADNDALLFVDVANILDGVAATGELDDATRANLQPFKALIYTATGDATRTNVDVFLLVR